MWNDRIRPNHHDDLQSAEDIPDTKARTTVTIKLHEALDTARLNYSSNVTR